MALYHQHAEKLKPLVENANFTKEQLNTVLRLMENCSQLRQGSVIRSFFDLVLPEKFEMKEDTNNPVTYSRNGNERTFNPTIILNKGEELPPATEKTKLDEQLEKVKESGMIE